MTGIHADRIYLDNAATSWPKPPAVVDAVVQYMRDLGAAAGRGNYRAALEADRLVEDARLRTARLLHASPPSHVVFGSNGTDALNLVLHGWLRPGDHVVTSVAEHNSVLRPLRFLETARGISVTRVPVDGQGAVDPDDIQKALTTETRLIALIHASNVTGIVQPAEAVSRIAADHGVPFLLDAAQSLGHLPWTLSEIPADFVAAPTHKGLLGPLGGGMLYVAPGREEDLLPVRQGGTGSVSEQDTQPETMPDKFESGNHAVPALAGLAAALEFLEDRGLDALHAHEMTLTARLLDGLGSMPGIRILGPPGPVGRVGVVSIEADGIDPQELAATLDGAASIECRPGLHCAPEMHRAIGTFARGGTLRFSVGPFNTEVHIDTALEVLAEVTGQTGAASTGWGDGGAVPTAPPENHDRRSTHTQDPR